MPALKVIDATGSDRWVYFACGNGSEESPFRGFDVAPWRLLVSQGRVPGHTVLDKFGCNVAISKVTTPEDIWEGGGLYPWSTTADIVSLSSSDDGDDQPITVKGLDATGHEVDQTVALNGQTRVALPTPLLRVWRMENDGITDIAGTVYCYSGTANTLGVPSGASVEKARISNGNNQTLMALFTIPLGKVGFLFRGELGLANALKTGYATCHYMSRRWGKVFKIKKCVPINISGTTIYQDERSFPDPIPALTDVKLTVEEVSDDDNVISAAIDVLLVDEAELDAAFLTAIGQPSSV